MGTIKRSKLWVIASTSGRLRKFEGPAAQRELFPGFVVVADELALDFEEKYRELPCDTSLFTSEQAQAVEALDKALEAMSGPGHEELWTVEALDRLPKWDHIRQLAGQVIRAMGWSDAAPPPNRAIYVGPDAWPRRRLQVYRLGERWKQFLVADDHEMDAAEVPQVRISLSSTMYYYLS